jgi:hypothetical protein
VAERSKPSKKQCSLGKWEQLNTKALSLFSKSCELSSIGLCNSALPHFGFRCIWTNPLAI